MKSCSEPALPRISVILPTYNRGHLVAEAIGSVLIQTYSDIELIVIDDGSTDNTEEVITSFIDPRLIYLKQLNSGVSAARNAGLEASSGEAVAFLDSDDLWLPQKLEQQIAKFDHNPGVGLVYSLYYSTLSNGAPNRLSGSCYPQLTLRQLLFGTVFHWSTVLIARSWVERVCCFDEQVTVGEEWDLTLKLALSGCCMECVPQPLVIVRQQPNSLAKKSYLHEESLLTVLDRAFDDPRMPTELLDLQNLARASQLIRIAASAYVTSQQAIGWNFLKRALELEPSLVNEHIDDLVNLLVYKIRGLSTDNPKDVLSQVTKHSATENTNFRLPERRLWGKFYEIAAFQSYQLGQRAECIADVIRAFSKTPSCLRNRGLISIFVRSLVGNRVVNGFKGLYHTQRRSVAE